jgi:hypothetical protein
MTHRHAVRSLIMIPDREPELVVTDRTEHDRAESVRQSFSALMWFIFFTLYIQSLVITRQIQMYIVKTQS